MKKLAITCITLATMTAYAQPVLVERDPNQTEVNTHSPIDSRQLENDQLRKQILTTIDKSNEVREVRYSARELINNPRVLEELLLKAVLDKNITALPALIKVYEYVPERDDSLIEWGKAIIERQVNLAHSTKNYRELVEKFPTNPVMRFQFAETLFFNRNYKEAKAQFGALSNIQGISSEDVAIVNNYLTAINKREDWDFSLGGNFLNDKNLSNSAKEGTTIQTNRGTFTSGKRQTGQGVAARISASKQWHLASGRFLQFDSNLSSKYYWDNKSYNEINAYAAIGLGYADARKNLSMTPNLQKRWYAGGSSRSEALKQYSTTYGVNLAFDYWSTPNLKYSFSYDLGYDKHDRAIYASQYDGASHAITNAILYIPKSEQYWLFAIDFSQKNAKSEINAYDRFGSRITWGQEWPLGFTTASTLGIAKRNYYKRGFLGLLQENKEYSARLSISNKNIQYAGIIPKLTLSYSKTSSSIPIYSYDKKQVLLEIGKSF